MKRNQFLVVTTTALAALVGAAGCGDNSHDCGTGTKLDDNGYCVPDSTGSICGDGTVLDTATNTCLPDPSVCGGGTVLVNGTCQDPTGNLTIDLEEGPEPNGFETGATPAGAFSPKPVNQGFVIHGCVRPVNDAPDFDNYLVTVTEPTLLDITADGVNGLAAGFFTLGDPGDADPQIQNYLRIGMNLATDMSQRQLFLPKAGTYALVLTDSRTILPFVDGSTMPAAGDPNGNTTCYYVTVAQKTPAPVALDLAQGDTGTIGKDIKFYSATIGDGFTELGGSIDSQFALPSLVLMNNNALRQLNDGTPNSDLFFAGIKAGDTPIIVLDYVYNYDLVPPTYNVTTLAQVGAQPLSRTGGAVSETELSSNPAGVADFNLFYYDVGAADEIDGFNLAWNVPVDGVVADQDGFFAARFTGFSGDTFDSYIGLIRHRAAGRYYFVVYDPAGAPGSDMITATSTIGAVTPTAVVEGTPMTGVAIDDNFQSNAFTYAAGNVDAWQQFLGAASAGDVELRFYDPANSYGRLDDLPPGIGFADNGPIFANTFVSGDPAIGRILLDDPTTNFLVTANTSVVASGTTFDLDFQRRTHTDLGTVAVSSIARTGDTFDVPDFQGIPAHFYLLRTDVGNVTTVLAHPQAATTDLGIASLGNDESFLDAVDNTGNGADETIRIIQSGNGWTAFAVGTFTGVDTDLFDLNITVDPPFYSVHNSTTAFDDACTGGTTQAITTGDQDEGLTDPVTPPSGFSFYGTAATDLVITTNGFLTFNTGIGRFTFQTAPLPDGVGDANIAPLWADLDGVTICTKTVGSKLVVQWTGAEFTFFGVGAPAQFQAILDPADSSIEYVYGPDHQLDSTTSNNFMVSGVQSTLGNEATVIAQGTTLTIAPGSSKKLTHP